MRSTMFRAAAAFSLFALVAACAASGAADGIGIPQQDKQPTDPGSSTQLPPPSAPETAKDAGKDSAPAKPGDAGDQTPPDDTPVDCDPNDKKIMLEAAVVLASMLDPEAGPPPPSCPCSTGQCCYASAFCLDL